MDAETSAVGTVLAQSVAARRRLGVVRRQLAAALRVGAVRARTRALVRARLPGDQFRVQRAAERV